MSVRNVVVAIGSCVLAGGLTSAAAHHSFSAEYDRDQPVTITGKVTSLEWTNPHARLYVEAVDADGKTVVWNLELGPPNGLMRQGWRRDSLVAGTVVTVDGFRSRTEAHVANVRTVKLSDGREVFAGKAFDTTKPAEPAE
jgi:hypothetical protein